MITPAVKPKPPTDDEKNQIVRMFARQSIGEIAEFFGRRASTIEQVIRESLWGLAKLNQQLTEENKRLVQNDPRHGESIHEFFQD